MPAKSKSPAAPPERRLAAILAAEIADYGRITVNDDEQSHDRIAQAMAQLREAIEKASGRIFSFAGSGLIAEFASATEALKCGLRIQAEAARQVAGTQPIRFRMGFNVGEILVGHRHIGGAAINVAARLQHIAPAGGIALPIALHEQLRHAVPVAATPMGQPDLHDLATPMVVMAISPKACLAWAGDTARSTRPSPQPTAVEPRASLAVVPFRSLAAQDLLPESAIDDVIRGLAGVATWLAVIRTPPRVTHTPIDLQRIRQTTGAAYILHGTAEAERDRVRLTVEVNEAATGRVLWSDRFEHQQGQQAALRQDAASHISRAVPPLLLRREFDRAMLSPMDTLTAHDLALRAFGSIMQPERHSFAGAADLLRQAEQRPPPHDSTRFAQVWWHLMAVSQGWSADSAEDVRAAAAAAARMNPNDPAARALLAFMHSVLHRDHGLASAMLDRVIDAAPFCALAGSLKALTLSWIGEAQSAIFHAEQAETMPELGPERAWRDHVAALAYYLGGRYGEAARWARVSAMHHPGLAANARLLAASLAVLGQLDDAHQAARQVLAIDPEFHIGAWWHRSMLPEPDRSTFAQRLRLAGLPA